MPTTSKVISVYVVVMARVSPVKRQVGNILHDQPDAEKEKQGGDRGGVHHPPDDIALHEYPEDKRKRGR